MSIIIYALGVITGLLITFLIEWFTRKPSDRRQPLAKIITKKEGVILESNPIYNSFMNYNNNQNYDYDSSRDTEDISV